MGSDMKRVPLLSTYSIASNPKLVLRGMRKKKTLESPTPITTLFMFPSFWAIDAANPLLMAIERLLMKNNAPS